MRGYEAEAYDGLMGLTLGYVRTSTTDQHGKIQFEAIKAVGVPEERIWFDQLSGAKAAKERPGLTELLAYAREDDEIVVYRIDRLGRSLIDVLNTVELLQKRKIRLQSLIDGVDPSTSQGRMLLGLFATLAEYERELINERVRAGVQAAKARGVRFGQKPVSEETIEARLKVARRLLNEGSTAERAAETVGWSRATLYRYLRHRGREETQEDQILARGRGPILNN